MKNIVNIIRTKANKIAIFLQVRAKAAAAAVQAKSLALSRNNAGVSETVEKILWAVVAVVVVSIALGLIVVLVQKLIPEIGAKIEAMFNFT